MTTWLLLKAAHEADIPDFVYSLQSKKVGKLADTLIPIHLVFPILRIWCSHHHACYQIVHDLSLVGEFLRIKVSKEEIWFTCEAMEMYSNTLTGKFEKVKSSLILMKQRTIMLRWKTNRKQNFNWALVTTVRMMVRMTRKKVKETRNVKRTRVYFSFCFAWLYTYSSHATDWGSRVTDLPPKWATNDEPLSRCPHDSVVNSALPLSLRTLSMFILQYKDSLVTSRNIIRQDQSDEKEHCKK